MKLSPFIRHSFAAAAGAVSLLASRHESLSLFLSALAVYLICLAWSALEKGSDAVGVRAKLKLLMGAAASQMLSALSGLLAVKSGRVDDPAALALFGSANVLSQVRPGHVRSAAGALLACLLALPLASCSNVSRDAFLARMQETGETIAREASATALQITLDGLRAELSALENKPLDDDAAQRLADAARLASLRELIRKGDKRLAELRAANAARLTAKASAPVVSVARPVKRWRRASIPILAPAVVASLRASP